MSWPDPYCENGYVSGSSCFRLDCEQYGGPGCQGDCCYQYINLDSTPYCDEVVSGNSCKIRDPDPGCTYGNLVGGQACFPIACPQFGGVGCRSPCCFYEYETDSRPYCDEAGPGCRMRYCKLMYH